MKVMRAVSREDLRVKFLLASKYFQLVQQLLLILVLIVVWYQIHRGGHQDYTCLTFAQAIAQAIAKTDFMVV